MSPEDNLLHTALHICSDGYAFHHSLIDAAVLLNNESIDLDIAKKRAEKWKCSVSFYFLLFLLSKVAPYLDTKRHLPKYKFRYYLIWLLAFKQFRKKTVLRRLQQASLQYFFGDSIYATLKLQQRYIKLWIQR